MTAWRNLTLTLVTAGVLLLWQGFLPAQGRGGGGQGRRGVGAGSGSGSGGWGRNGSVVNDANGDGVDDFLAERLRLHRAKSSAQEQRGNMLRALGFPADAELRIVSSPGDIPGLKTEDKKRLKAEGIPAAPELYTVDADRSMVICYGWTRDKGLLICWYLLFDKGAPRKVEGKILREGMGDFASALTGPLPEKVKWENPPGR